MHFHNDLFLSQICRYNEFYIPSFNPTKKVLGNPGP